MLFSWEKHGHALLWAAVAIVGFIIVVGYFGWIISAVIGQIFLFGIIAALVFAADWFTVKMLSSPGLQVAAAILIAVLAGMASSHSLGMNLFLRVCDVIIIMCVFSLSASIWHNSETVMKTVHDLQEGKADPLDTLKNAASNAGDAIKRGVDTTVAQAKGAADHFKSS